VPAGSGVKHVQILNNAFSDNAISVAIAGDYPPPNYDPTPLRTTFTIANNAVTGLGATTLDYQLGILILGGATGVIKGNRISDHYNASPTGNWSVGLYGRSDMPVALQPLRIEANTFSKNEKNLLLVHADNCQIIRNHFESTGDAALPSDGVYMTGANILTAINLFTNLSTGIVLAANDPKLGGPSSGVAIDPSVLANRFCAVSTPVWEQWGVVRFELGTEVCPWSGPGTGNLVCSPNCGLPGETISLCGTNLTGASMVLFNGRSATFVPGADPATVITATVPAHATSGPVTVITPTGNVTALTSFTVPVSLAMQMPDSGQIELSWSAEASDLLLETTSDLGQPDWQMVPTSPSIGAERAMWRGTKVPVPQFFRLRQP
jgi:hypothetical protein